MFDTNVVSPILAQAFTDFFNKNRDLVACVRGGQREVFQRIQSEMMLDDEAEAAVADKYNELTSQDSELAGSALAHSNIVVRDVARGFMKIAFYQQICLSYLRLMARGALSYAIALTAEAEEQKFQLEVDSGCRLRQSAIERQARQQTAAQDLDGEITADWNGRLRTDEIRAKKGSNPLYAARLDQLLNEGKLS